MLYILWLLFGAWFFHTFEHKNSQRVDKNFIQLIKIVMCSICFSEEVPMVKISDLKPKFESETKFIVKM